MGNQVIQRDFPADIFEVIKRDSNPGQGVLETLKRRDNNQFFLKKTYISTQYQMSPEEVNQIVKMASGLSADFIRSEVICI
jgi:hypothetical protein